jgi:hypothetical protein
MGIFAETAMSNIIYQLPTTKENKHLLSVSICSKQTEVYRFHFPFAENKRKLPFSVSFIFLLQNSGNVET